MCKNGRFLSNLVKSVDNSAKYIEKSLTMVPLDTETKGQEIVWIVWLKYNIVLSFINLEIHQTPKNFTNDLTNSEIHCSHHSICIKMFGERIKR